MTPTFFVSVYPQKFSGQEQIAYWAVIYADGVGPGEGFRDLQAAARRNGEVWIVAKNLNLDDVKTIAVEVAITHPERRYFVMPLLLPLPPTRH
jgi:hypothetical protein